MALFSFPFSIVMQSYVFGNFEQELAFNQLSEEDVAEVLNEVNSGVNENTKASLSLVNLREEDPNEKESPDVIEKKQERSQILNPEIETLRKNLNRTKRSALGWMGILGFLPLFLSTGGCLLYWVKLIPTDNKLLMKSLTLYIPSILTSIMLMLLGKKLNNKEFIRRELQSSILPKSIKINKILDRWNMEKFQPLNFTWSFNTNVDCLELSVDSNLEVFDSK